MLCACNRYDYANKIALELFEATWEELVGQQSDCTNQHKDTVSHSIFKCGCCNLGLQENAGACAT